MTGHIPIHSKRTEYHVPHIVRIIIIIIIIVPAAAAGFRSERARVCAPAAPGSVGVLRAARCVARRWFSYYHPVRLRYACKRCCFRRRLGKIKKKTLFLIRDIFVVMTDKKKKKTGRVWSRTARKTFFFF